MSLTGFNRMRRINEMKPENIEKNKKAEKVTTKQIIDVVEPSEAEIEEAKKVEKKSKKEEK